MTNALNEPVQAPPRARMYSQWFMGCLLATVMLYFLSIPYLYFTWLTAPATVTFAILALVATRSQAGIAGLRIGLSLGILFAGFSMLLALGTWIFQDAFLELRDCEARALTITAHQECQTAYNDAYKEQLERFGLTAP